MEIMSRTDLAGRLDNIRTAINIVKQHDISNVIFLNIEGFAHFADDLLYTAYNRTMKIPRNGLSTALAEIEPYIPLVLSDENLSIFLEAAVSDDNMLINELERAFLADAKARFVNSAYNAEDDEWGEIVSTCEKIRSYREGGAVTV